MTKTSFPRCPSCQEPLKVVRQTGECMFNDEQFDSMKAGDYYCETCPGNGRGKSGLKYWWKRELDGPKPEHVCGKTGFNPMIDPPCPACK